jgi:predicted CoA-binding protein
MLINNKLLIMVTLNQIEKFIASQPVAVIGVSRNPKKFGYAAFKELKEKGMDVIPVNPFTNEIFGVKAFPDIKSLPSEVRSVIIMTNKEQTAKVVREAKEKGISQIWFQQKSDTPEAIMELKGSNIDYITKECILMHYKPNSVHKFHGGIKKFFGLFPK